jgi:hypothetical protein
MTGDASTKDTRQPRKPNEIELKQLTQFTSLQYKFSSSSIENEKEAANQVSRAFIAVFDDYCTGSPGWAGKLMVVVWDGSPGQYEVYTWQDGKLERQEKE